MHSPRRDSQARSVLWLTEFLSPLQQAWIEREMRSFSASEAQRLARIRRPIRREQFVAGHVLLRRLLMSVGVAEPMIDVAPDGRPHLAAADGASAWHVSLAHSRNAVAALASPAAAGVDIEVRRSLRDPHGVAALLGSSAATFAAATAAGSDPSESALKSWVAAEARAKAGSAASTSGDTGATWIADWNGCWICVAGTANSPETFVSDLTRETYNSAPQQWVAAP